MVGFRNSYPTQFAQIAACEESWEVFSKVFGKMLMDLLDNATGSSYRLKLNAVAALLNLVQCGGQEVARDVRGKLEVGVVEGIGDIVQSGSEKGKTKALALLKILDASY